jgi:RND family efflux transporter MFP subunit
MKYIYTFFAVIFLTGSFSSCEKAKATRSTSGKTESVSVRIASVTKEKIRAEIYTAGQFTTNDETYLAFKTGGIVSSVLVREGDFVRKGQVLATLDLTEINAQVSQAKLGFEKAERDFTRVKNLYHDSVATLEQLQNAKTALDVADQQLKGAKFNQNYSEIRAVANGYILRKFLNTGQLVAAGSPVFQTNGAGSSEWILKAGVSDREWAMIKTGDSSVIETDVLPGKKLKAVVVRKAEGADPVTGSLNVELKLNASGVPSIAAGLFGKATIYPSSAQEVWTIPYPSLLEGNGGKGYVFVTDNLRTARKAEVRIGSVEKDKVIVTEGLENVQYLIVEGSPYLKENSTITIVK